MPHDGNCPGSCNHRYRRAQAIYKVTAEAHARRAALLAEARLPVPEAPRPPKVEAWPGDPVWCQTPRQGLLHSCHAIIRTQLSELDDLGSSLAALPPGIRAAVEARHERVKVSGTHGVPSPSPSADTLDELTGWLRAWEAIAKGDDERPRRGVLATERHAMINALTDFLDPLLANPEVAGDFGTEVFRWHRELVALTHSGKQAKHVKQQCPNPSCRKYTLWEYPGEDYIRCVNPSCNARPTREELAKVA